MEKDFDNMSKEEMNEWMDSLSKPEQLAEARKLMAELREKYGDDPNEVTPDEYARLQDTITFLEIAIEFEAWSLVEDVKKLPEADALEMMWDWLGDLAGDRERVKQMGIDVETIRRWSKYLGTHYDRASKRRKELRKQGIIIPTLYRPERPEYNDLDNAAVTKLQNPESLTPLLPNLDPRSNN